MKRNGFTLIELLAVIVVLAIIALIATPIVLNIINNAKTSSNERSGELYVKAVENAIMKKQMNGTDVVTSGDYTVQSDGSICIVSNNVCSDGTTITIDVEGVSPESGTLTVSNGVVVSYNLVVSGTSIVKIDSSSNDDDNEEKRYDITFNANINWENYEGLINREEETEEYLLVSVFERNNEIEYIYVGEGAFSYESYTENIPLYQYEQNENGDFWTCFIGGETAHVEAPIIENVRILEGTELTEWIEEVGCPFPVLSDYSEIINLQERQ